MVGPNFTCVLCHAHVLMLKLCQDKRSKAWISILDRDDALSDEKDWDNEWRTIRFSELR